MKNICAILGFALFLCATTILNCGGESTPTSEEVKTQSTMNTDSKSTPSPHKIADLLQDPKERYQGSFVDGKPFDSFDHKGTKLIFAYFNINNPLSKNMLKALEQIVEFENQYHFKIFAVSVNVGEQEAVKAYLSANQITFPTLLEDKNLSLATKLKVNNDLSLMGVNNDHVLSFGIKKYVYGDSTEGTQQFVDYLKESLSLPQQSQTVPYLGILPKAPDFTFTTLAGKHLKLSSFKGKVVFLFFFSPKCPHCQHEIQFLKRLADKELQDAGLEILAISVLDLKTPESKTAYDALKITDWHVVDDSSREIRDAYSQLTSIPEVFYINREGLIEFHDTGYGPTHDDLITMKLKKLLGLPNPPLLSSTKYNGVQSCLICHGDEYVDWSVTPHAHAFETLQIKGEETNLDCIGCHTLGLNDSKGFAPTKLKNGKTVGITPEPLQNVQCESCHGIGGAHVSTPHTTEEMQKNCLSCHTEKFSLHFDFAERIKKVNHSEKNKILNMNADERVALLEKVSKNPHDLFGSKMKYVGSDKCMECHTDTHKNWQGSAHAKAFETLKSQDKTTDTNCLKCHTVGYGQPGGYQESVAPAFEGVGCESCHGPGEVHVQSKKKEDIRSLGDDCPFCVIEQICLSCHDAKNDPDFNIYKALEQIKGHK